MDESTKTKKIWGELERSVLTGKGIDIGCGPDPVLPDVRGFDMEDGDANVITQHVKEEFDFVYASHCLEHMHDPRKAILEWWKLVRVGGHLFVIIPDEDLYEQGVFPSRFNGDHKATFTLSKQKSWSPVSINVYDLARSLPNGSVINMVLQDLGYDRRLMKHGPVSPNALIRFVLRAYASIQWRFKITLPLMERFREKFFVVDQTLRPNALAQIQFIVKKMG